MNIFLIAQIINGNKVVGYRLIDVDDHNKISDYPLANIVSVLSNPNTANIIRNAKLVNGVVTGTNGQLSRYPKINTKGVPLSSNGPSPLIVINKIDNIGYTVVDYKGTVKKMKNSDVVKYAKTFGIANGKVILNDNVEYISSISDSYDQISVSPSKVGGNNSRVNIDIHIGKDASQIAKHTENDIDTELQYNDVFESMTMEQRKVVKQYYTWYTVEAYQKLAKNVRLDLAPGKAEKLAQLRGIEKWKFAGVNDSHLEGRFDAKCELGHNLRYEYFAIPEDETQDLKARNKDWTNYSRFKTTRNMQDELRDRGAIVFGETCAGDFFNIAPEDMKKLVKIRKIMSEEIEQLADVITNKAESTMYNKCEFLYKAIREMGDTKNVIEVFGDKVAYTLLSFMKYNVPFTKSLVITACDKIRENTKTFYLKVFKDYTHIINKIFGTPVISNLSYDGARQLLKYVVNYTVEGSYQYNPLTDSENSRRDIGAYNKNTRQERSIMIKRIKDYTLISNRTVDNLKLFFNTFSKLDKASIEIENYISNSEELRNLDRVYSCLESFIKSTRTVLEINDDNIKMFDYMLSSLALSPKYGKYNKYTVYTHCYSVGYRGRARYRYLSELLDNINYVEDKYSISNVIDKTLKKYEEQIEYDKDAYFKIKLNYGKIIFLCTNNLRKKLLRDFIKGYEIEDLSFTENKIRGAITFYSNEIETVEEITEQDYFNKDKIVDTNTTKKEEEVKIEEAEAKREEIKEEIKKDETSFNQDNIVDKVEKLKMLFETVSGIDDNDYGIKVARDIISRGVSYNKLSHKQKWRIDQTIKELESKNKTQGTDDKNNDTTEDSKENEPLKFKITDEVAVMVNRILAIAKSNDKELISKIDEASSIAINVARTVSYKKEYSVRQLKHIEKAYNAVR